MYKGSKSFCVLFACVSFYKSINVEEITYFRSYQVIVRFCNVSCLNPLVHQRFFHLKDYFENIMLSIFIYLFTVLFRFSFEMGFCL